MESGDARHDVAFPIGKPRNVAIADQVFGVTMMLLVTHRVPDVVQHRRHFEIGPDRHRQAMKARQLVEHCHRECRHLHGMGLIKKEAPAHRPCSINERRIICITKAPAHEIHEHAVAKTTIDRGDRAKRKMMSQGF